MSQSISGGPVLGFWYNKSYNYIKCSPLIAFVFQLSLLLKWTFRWGLLPDISILSQDDEGFIIVLFSFKLNINPLILSLCRIRWFLSRHTPKYSSNVRHSSTWLSIIQHCRVVYSLYRLYRLYCFEVCRRQTEMKPTLSLLTNIYIR